MKAKLTLTPEAAAIVMRMYANGELDDVVTGITEVESVQPDTDPDEDLIEEEPPYTKSSGDERDAYPATPEEFRYEEIKKKYPVGSIHMCRIEKVSNIGIFVSLGEDVSGLVPARDMKPHVATKIKDVFIEGDILKVRLIAYKGIHLSIASCIMEISGPIPLR
jgi:polyribonucleotide nucleotidyltransferase